MSKIHKPFYMGNKQEVYHCPMEELPLAKGTVDLTVTSPPYNLQMEYGTYDDALRHPEYLERMGVWLARILELSKVGGRLCLNIPLDTGKGAKIPFYSDVVSKALEVGWRYRTTIVWNEQSLSSGTAWGSWISPSAPNVIMPVEMVAVFYRDEWKLPLSCRIPGGGGASITPEEFKDWVRNLWTFRGERKSAHGHPAAFPVELPRRCIRLFSYKSGLILDPFLGSGSTLVAAATEGRNGVGCDIDLAYVRKSRDRLSQLFSWKRVPRGEEDEWDVETQAGEEES